MTDPIDHLIEVTKELESRAPYMDVETVSKVLPALRSALPYLERLREESRWRYCGIDDPVSVPETFEEFIVSRHLFDATICGTAFFSDGKWLSQDDYELLDGVYAYRPLPEKAPQGGAP